MCSCVRLHNIYIYIIFVCICLIIYIYIYTYYAIETNYIALEPWLGVKASLMPRYSNSIVVFKKPPLTNMQSRSNFNILSYIHMYILYMNVLYAALKETFSCWIYFFYILKIFYKYIFQYDFIYFIFFVVFINATRSFQKN